MTERATFGGRYRWRIEAADRGLHQNDYEKNPATGYCRTHAEPKVRETFETESATAR